MLQLPHVAPLTDFARSLRSRAHCEVPDFDPADGGINARMLFLFEKPGPMTAVAAGARRAGSGFISRDNDDLTASATFNFMMDAKIPRRTTVLWNLIPWWNGTRGLTRSEITDGLSALRQLLVLLPDVRGIVLVGKTASKAQGELAALPVSVHASRHPSPLVRARWPDQWAAIPSVWAAAYAKVEESADRRSLR